MHESLNKNLFFVKEHVGVFKAANNFDILDPQTKKAILECREERLGILTKLLRFTEYKRYTPFDIDIRTPDGKVQVRIKRGITLIRSTVEVFDGGGQLLGTFKQKLISIGGKFQILDPQENPLCMLKGKWTGWDFRFMRDETELAHVTKKWAGLGKEMFTTADNYILEINASVPANDPVRPLILAAVMCIDMVLKE